MLIASVALSHEMANYTLLICLGFAIHKWAGMLAKQRLNSFFFKDLILLTLSDLCFHTGLSLTSFIVQKGKVHTRLVLVAAKNLSFVVPSTRLEGDNHKAAHICVN